MRAEARVEALETEIAKRDSEREQKRAAGPLQSDSRSASTWLLSCLQRDTGHHRLPVCSFLPHQQRFEHLQPSV